MAEPKLSYAQLTHDVVHGSSEPLTVNEIIEHVNAIRPITTKNPKSTIRGAIGDSRLIVATGDGRYGWMPRLINGSIIRQTLTESDNLMEVLQWGVEVREALWPTFFAKQKYQDRGPILVLLPNGKTNEFALEHLHEGAWGTYAAPEFWEWFSTLNAGAGDHLLFKVEDGETKRYSVTFQARSERDEQAMAERNEIFHELIGKMLNRPYGAAPWDISARALATGLYRHPIPPDPLDELLQEWVIDAAGTVSPEPELAQLFGELFGPMAQVHDTDNPPDLPREYNPDIGRRRPRPSTKSQAGTLTSYMFRVNHRALPKVWREIELAEDQTLEDLHLAIQKAFDWYNDHLYSFFTSGRAWDTNTEIGSPWSESRIHTHQVQIGQMDLEEGRKILYLLDYGDSHEFDVTLRSINHQAKKGKFPKIVAKQGKSPPQYQNYDDDTGQGSWDPYSHWR